MAGKVVGATTIVGKDFVQPIGDWLWDKVPTLMGYQGWAMNDVSFNPPPEVA